MKTGEIYYWVTDKARGYVSRPKYHVFICEEDWQYGYTFLFINSDNYGEDFQITNAECAFLPKAVSYISCSEPVFYDAHELKTVKPELKGALPADCIKRLWEHVAASNVLERRYITRVCNALRPFLA